MRRLALAALAVGAAGSAAAQTLTVREGGPARIEQAHYDVAVEEGIAHVTVEQRFRNATDRAQEGVYEFRLPADAVIGAFSMWMAGKEQRGLVQEAQAARAKYESIVARQRDPGLLEQTGWRDFRVNVFPIPPRDTVRIKLVYAHLVRDDGGLETLELPLPLRAGAVDDLRVDARVRSAAGLAGLDCPTHSDAKLGIDASGGRLAWHAAGVAPTGPLTLRSIPRADRAAVTLLAHRPAGATEGWFVARVVPRREAPPPLARDVVFVVDVSGSMAGTKLAQASAALKAGLASLNPYDRFDVITFAATAESLANRRATPLLAVAPDSLAVAIDLADHLDASGGTNLGAALDLALARCHAADDRGGEGLAPSGDRYRAVVLLTDGDPTIGEQVPERLLAQWRSRAGATRLFAFGVGDGVKEFLLSKLAAAGRGEARYVREGDDLEVPLAALFDRMRTPLALDPELTLEGEGIALRELEPRRLPDLFQGRPLLVCGRYTGHGAATLRLVGDRGGQPLELALPIELPATTPDRPHVPQLWAKTRVERLLDELRVDAASGGREGGAAPELRAEIVHLGVTHQLVTPFTSFLVLEPEARVVGGDAAQPLDDGSRIERLPEPAKDDAIEPIVADDAADRRLPFDGRGHNEVIGVGGGGCGVESGRYGRRGGSKGGGRATQQRVEALLTELKARQARDGGWSSGGAGPDQPTASAADVVDTALATLAFLGTGNTLVSGCFKSQVFAASRRLQSWQSRDDGFVGPKDEPESHLAHALATLALCEAYHLSRQPIVKLPAQQALDAIERLRLPQGGFASGPVRSPATSESASPPRADAGTTALMLEALLAGRAARLSTDLSTIRDGLAALASADPGHLAPATMVGARLLLECLASGALDEDANRDARHAKWAAAIAAHPVDAAAPDLWHLLWSSHALWQIGGRSWDAQQTVLLQTLVAPTPSTVASADAGERPLRTVALTALCLEVYYRYDRLLMQR